MLVGEKVKQQSTDYGSVVQVADGKQLPQHRSMASWPRLYPSPDLNFTVDQFFAVGEAHLLIV